MSFKRTNGPFKKVTGNSIDYGFDPATKVTVVEDEWTKTKERQGRLRKKIDRLKGFGLGPNDKIIQIYEDEAKMSNMEYEYELKQEDKQRKEYLDNTPMREEVVNHIYNWFDEHGDRLKENDKIPAGDALDIPMLLRMEMDLLGILGNKPYMTQKEYDFGLYSPLIDGIVSKLLEERKENNGE